MLTIRNEQVHTLSAEPSAAFSVRLAEHLRRFFPKRCEALGPEDLAQRCQEIVERGRGYGIRSERDLCKLANVHFVLGDGFDTDPRLPWARALLTEADCGPTLRINRLVIAAVRHLQQQPPHGAAQ